MTEACSNNLPDRLFQRVHPHFSFSIIISSNFISMYAGFDISVLPCHVIKKDRNTELIFCPFPTVAIYDVSSY
jgi:hypothetical protein